MRVCVCVCVKLDLKVYTTCRQEANFARDLSKDNEQAYLITSDFILESGLHPRSLAKGVVTDCSKRKDGTGSLFGMSQSS